VSTGTSIAGGKANIVASSHMSISSWTINLDMNSVWIQYLVSFALLCKHNGTALQIVFVCLSERLVFGVVNWENNYCSKVRLTLILFKVLNYWRDSSHNFKKDWQSKNACSMDLFLPHITQSVIPNRLYLSILLVTSDNNLLWVIL